MMFAFERLFNRPTGRDADAHMTSDEAKKKLGPEIWKSYLKVSTYRDPFLRFVSSANFIHPIDLDITGFAEHVKNVRNDTIQCVYCKDQNEFIKDMDFLIRLDYMQDDFNVFCDKIGLKTNYKLLKANMGLEKPFYDVEDLKRIYMGDIRGR
jgi:hypothetical protein